MPLDVILLIIRTLIVLVLYSFLGLLLYYIWKDVRAVGSIHREYQRAPGRLVVVKSDSAVMDVGRGFTLQPLTTIGRGPSNTIILPDTTASTDHAHIVWRRGQWWLEDQHSRNGTSVNDMPVTDPVVLAAEDEIGVGRVRFRLELEQPRKEFDRE